MEITLTFITDVKLEKDELRNMIDDGVCFYDYKEVYNWIKENMEIDDDIKLGIDFIDDVNFDEEELIALCEEITEEEKESEE